MSNVISVSIVLCTYNRAQSLRRTLQQFERVRVPPEVPVEVVVVNNNSTDSTPDVCAAFDGVLPVDLKYCFEPKPGLSNARNHGLAAAKGEIVLFIDDDIDVPENWIEGYVDIYRRHEPDAAFGKIIPEWGGNRPDWYHPKLSPIYGALDYGDAEDVVNDKKKEFFGANFSVRKSLLEAMGAFDTALGRTPDALYISEERKVFLSLIASQSKVVYSPAISVRHRVSPAMKTKAYVDKYYCDTATSLFFMTPQDSPRRIFGVPYYRAAEAIRNLAMFAPRAAAAILSGDSNALYPLRLETQRSLRICLLHIRNR